VQNVLMPVVPVAATPLLSVPLVVVQLNPDVNTVALLIALLDGCAYKYAGERNKRKSTRLLRW